MATDRSRSLSQLFIMLAVFMAVAMLLAFAFVPGLRDTRVGRALRFWQSEAQTTTSTQPAVPPGQLAKELAADKPLQSDNRPVNLETADDNSATSDTITIDAATAANLSLQTVAVEMQTIEQQIRTTGRIAVDARRITHIHTKVDGFIVKAFADFEGQQIRPGQPLFTFYSPELVATEQEYLLALRARTDFQKSEFNVVRNSGDALVNATRRRLKLWDLTDAQIDELERSGKVQEQLTFYAPTGGIITARKAYPGMHIMPETDLYELADLAVVWVEADLFERDLAAIKLGARATITLPDGSAIASRVSYLNPLVDPATRTARVRMELANPNSARSNSADQGLRFKPGMFVNVGFNIPGAPQLVLPRDAVLDTGTRKLVLIDNGNDRFTLREIATGAAATDYYPVVAGLLAGDKVARNIQFLIDSETPLRELVRTRARLDSSGNSSINSSGNLPNASLDRDAVESRGARP